VARGATTRVDQPTDPSAGRATARTRSARSRVASALEAQQQPIGRGDRRPGAR